MGDESSYTSGLAVVESDAATIQWIWNRMFETAEPYHYWVPSGNRTIEIYVRDKREVAATLHVNETDATRLDGHDDSYMCHGLEDLVLRRLHDSRSRSSGTPTP